METSREANGTLSYISRPVDNLRDYYLEPSPLSGRIRNMAIHTNGVMLLKEGARPMCAYPERRSTHAGEEQDRYCMSRRLKKKGCDQNVEVRISANTFV